MIGLFIWLFLGLFGFILFVFVEELLNIVILFIVVGVFFVIVMVLEKE